MTDDVTGPDGTTAVDDARYAVQGVQRAALVTQRAVESEARVSPRVDRELRRMALLHRRDMTRRRRDRRRRLGALALARA